MEEEDQQAQQEEEEEEHEREDGMHVEEPEPEPDDEDARHHTRVSAAWREGLHALAQNLKCPICLGSVVGSKSRSKRKGICAPP
jgi:hypothetical protein